MLCADLYLWVSNIRKAKRALVRLTQSFPRKRITSPRTFTFPIRRMLLMINSVAISEALKKPLPVIAICNNSYTMREREQSNIFKYCFRDFSRNSTFLIE